MIDATATPPPISRESFFALYWDHARDLSLTTICCLAKINREYMTGLARTPWDELDEADRVKIRAAILELIEVHDHNRRIERACREATNFPKGVIQPANAVTGHRQGSAPTTAANPETTKPGDAVDAGAGGPAGCSSLEPGDAPGPAEKISEATRAA